MAERNFADRIAREKREFLERCVMCGSCLESCRIRPFSRYSDQAPAELQKVRIDFLNGGELSQTVYDMAFTCMGCHYCSKRCEQGLDPSRMGIVLRTELVNRGEAAPPTYSFALSGERFSYLNIMSAVLLNPSETRWITKLPESPESADVVYFPGCALHTTPARLFTGLDILDRMGLSYVALGGVSFCCGAPYMGAGRAAESGEYGGKLVEAISAFAPKTAVFSCPECTLRLKRDLADSPAHSFRTAHFSTFLGENLDRLKFERAIDKTVTVHDSCHLGRGLGEFEGTRRVLEAIPGVRVVEMEHSGKSALCCGGMTAMFDRDAAGKQAVGLLDEAKATGADMLVDLCYGCNRTLGRLARKKNYPFESISLVTLVGRAMGIEHEDKLALYMGWRDADRVIADARANIEASPLSEQEVRSFLEMIFSFM